tara:strand:- start:428 stop:724 length:297 start_codon:yes stop_codon:yes gene_type:complete
MLCHTVLHYEIVKARKQQANFLTLTLPLAPTLTLTQARKQQANFQLIVITHDEEFVQMIGRTDNCSHYFRVDKRLADNSNHNAAPHSVIDRFEIGRFG